MGTRCHNPRPITHDPSLALADAGDAAASTGTSRPKATVRSCPCLPLSYLMCSSSSMDSSRLSTEPLPPLTGAFHHRSPASRELRQRHIPPSYSGYI